MPIEGQIVTARGVDSSAQEDNLTHSQTVHVFDKHSDIHGLPDTYGKVASQASPVQLSGPLGPQKAVSCSGNTGVGRRLTVTELVGMLQECDGGEVSHTMHGRGDDVHGYIPLWMGSSHGLAQGLRHFASTVEVV